MRGSMRLSAPTPMSRSAIACCTSTAQRTRIDDARKLDQHAIAGGLDDAAVVLGDLRIEGSRRSALRRRGCPARRLPSAANTPPHRRRGSPRAGGVRGHPSGNPAPCKAICSAAIFFRVYVTGREDRSGDGDVGLQLSSRCTTVLASSLRRDWLSAAACKIWGTLNRGFDWVARLAAAGPFPSQAPGGGIRASAGRYRACISRDRRG